MKPPQFGERQYEMAAHIELARGGTSPFVPTQALEFYLGIDAAADPSRLHAIWRILMVHVPRRVHLSPTLWPPLPRQFHDEIPGKFCSLFIQFKVPVYQDSRRAKYHNHFTSPYYEVKITPHQQKALLQLQNRVRYGAIVRYASPAFWSRSEFDRHDESRQILANSAFVPPSRVRSHKKWMYAGPAGKVLLNPEPEGIDAEGWAAVLGELTAMAKEQSFREHVRDLAAALGVASEGVPPIAENKWLLRLANYGRFSQEDSSLLHDLSVVAQAAEAADSSWIALLLPRDEWKELLANDYFWMWRSPPW